MVNDDRVLQVGFFLFSIWIRVLFTGTLTAYEWLQTVEWTVVDTIIHAREDALGVGVLVLALA